MNFTATDHRHMRRALELAARGLDTTDPNPRVGAVIARQEDVLGEGWHERAGGPHAEVHALRAAGDAARGATVYITLEPCNHHGRTAPCTDALIAAGVSRVVCAMADPGRGAGGVDRLRAAGIAVEQGLLESSALDLNHGYVKRLREGAPWVRLKLGVSLDGRTALASGESRWITGEAARADVQRWRARSSAIVTSSTTVLRDDPRLDVRLAGATRQPLRVILDSNLETPPNARILDAPGSVLILTAATSAMTRAALEQRGARIVSIERAPTGGLDLKAVIRHLGSLEANEAWIECGPRLAGALVEARVVDEIVVYVAPTLLGNDARGMFDLPPLASLAARREWTFADVQRVGDDLRIRAQPRS